jgi:DnaJ-class molecular chaperone
MPRNQQVICLECNGTGAVVSMFDATCPECKGSGVRPNPTPLRTRTKRV